MKADETALASLHGLLAEELIRRIRNGEAAPSDLNVARQLLRDNNISCDGPRNSGLVSLADSLPDSLPDYPQ